MANCIVVVQFPLGKRTQEQAIASGTSTAPTYRSLAAKGLIRKDYLNGDKGTGGVYLWESREAAEAWFTPEREAMLTGEVWRCADPHVVRYPCHRGQPEGRNPC